MVEGYLVQGACLRFPDMAGVEGLQVWDRGLGSRDLGLRCWVQGFGFFVSWA